MKIERKEIQAAYLFVAILGQPPSNSLVALLKAFT
jgi:hypothetical protein